MDEGNLVEEEGEIRGNLVNKISHEPDPDRHGDHQRVIDTANTYPGYYHRRRRGRRWSTVDR